LLLLAGSPAVAFMKGMQFSVTEGCLVSEWRASMQHLPVCPCQLWGAAVFRYVWRTVITIAARLHSQLPCRGTRRALLYAVPKA